MLGEVMQGAGGAGGKGGKGGKGEHKIGNKTAGEPVVKTLDCCCCIVHSSLLKVLRFDENLDFHMYVEDLCHSAKKLGILSRVVQFDCRHLSGGNHNEALEKAAQYVMKKHNIKKTDSPCHK